MTVLAPDEYELIDLPRRFELRILFKPSRIKAILGRLRRRPADSHEPRAPSDGQPLERRQRRVPLVSGSSTDCAPFAFA